MRSTLFFSSSLFALQCIYPLVSAMAIPDEIPDDSDLPFPIIPPAPEPPSRPCDPFCNDPTYQLQDQIYPDKENLWIITPGRPGLYQSQTNPDIRKILGHYLDESLPYLLAQTVADPKCIPDLTNWGRRLLVDATLSIPQEKDAVNIAKLQNYINTVAPKAACGFFAAAAVPLLGVVADTIFFANQPNFAEDPNSFSTTHDQDYFLQPAFGPLAHAEFELNVHYSAKFPALFGTNPTAQEGRDIYLRSPATASKYRVTPQSAGNPAFKKQIRNLLHQFGETKQWAAVDYIDTDFQLRYLEEYCKAGFKFWNNKSEKVAAKDAISVGKLLEDATGVQFFEVWTKRTLYSQLGLPAERTYSPAATSCSQTQVYTLKFEKGSLQIKKCGACSRLVMPYESYKTNAWVGTGCN